MSDAVTASTISAPAYEVRSPAPLWEMGILAVWFSFTIGNMPFQTPVLYASVLYFVGRFALEYESYVDLIAKVWPVLLLPVWGAFSFLWTSFPGAAIQTIIYQLLTFVIMLVIAQRYHVRQIFQAMLIAGFVMMFVYMTIGSIEQALPFAHKNQLSLHVVMLLILGLWCLFDASQPIWLRIASVAFIAQGVVIVLGAESATGVVLMIVGITAFLLTRFVWSPAAGLKYVRTLMALTTSAIVVFAILIMLRLPVGELYADFVESLGKDTSLTGRTDLWNYADQISDEHPIAGVGVEGFWQESVGAAEAIKIDFYKDDGQRFNFHNAYLEVRVHLGYIGLGLFLFSLVWTMLQHVRNFVGQARPIDCAALVVALLLGVNAFTESAMWGNFNTYMHLYYLPALAAFGASRKRYLGDARVRVSESPGDGPASIALAD